MALNKFGVRSILQTLVFCSIHQFGHVWAPDNLLNSDAISGIEAEGERKRQARAHTHTHCIHRMGDRFISEYLALQFYHTVCASIKPVVWHIPTKSLTKWRRINDTRYIHSLSHRHTHTHITQSIVNLILRWHYDAIYQFQETFYHRDQTVRWRWLSRCFCVIDRCYYSIWIVRLRKFYWPLIRESNSVAVCCRFT